MATMTILTTRRLRLRTWRLSDAPAYHRACNNELVMELLGGVTTLKYVRAEVRWFVSHHERYGHTFWVIERKRDRALIGFCGIITIAERSSPMRGSHEIGWRVRDDMWGRGYAFEAASAVMSWYKKRPPGEHLVARIDKRNAASRGLAAKLGMKRNAKLERQHSDDKWLTVYRS